MEGEGIEEETGSWRVGKSEGQVGVRRREQVQGSDGVEEREVSKVDGKEGECTGG